MRDKSKGEPKKTSEQEALERSVDAMMDPKLPDVPEAEVPAEPERAPKTKSAKTAPQLPDKLRKQIAVSDASAQPISIEKLDDLAESITASKPARKRKKKEEPEQPDKQDEPEEKDEPDESEPAETVEPESTDLDDAQTDEAVDDIVSHEGDVMLAIEDATAAERNRQAEDAAGDSGGGFSTFVWSVVVIIAVIAIVLFVLLVTGGNIPGLKST